MSQVFGAGAKTRFQNPKVPLPGGAHRHAHPNIELPTASLAAACSFNQAPLRCAAPCQSRSRGTLLPSTYPHPSQAAFAPSVRSRWLSSVSRAWATAVLEACFYSLSDHRPLELGKRAGYLEKRACPSGSSCRSPVGPSTSPPRSLRGAGSCRVGRSTSGPGDESPKP